MLSFALAALVAPLSLGAPALPDCPLAKPTSTASAEPARLQKLADLPDANEVRLVLRKVGGCDYQEVTRFRVSIPASDRLRGPDGSPLGSVLVPDGARVMPAAPEAPGR